ncbi:MAG: ADP-ribosylglycohydrolase family protein, partial [Anaerolineae bacterium]|nr:ADP-ribosylglycohydrolase family protein [Anaerolineae bacterium]
MSIPMDYIERVYAGVLGKIIGVYLGRPVEGWTYERIMAELGELWYYPHEKLGLKHLVITDDDVSGTFTFLRALPDHGNTLDLTPAQIGETWLNYIIEQRTVLWWGGLGNSSEHTAYLRLKHGIPAPRSGSAALNGKIIANQIGAQIFIDGWAMVAPGDPQRAAELAKRAASVSHDEEAVYAAQVLAAMEAQAFVEQDIDRLLDTGLSVIPKNSVIASMIGEIRHWHAADKDWRKTRERIAEHYGYQKFGGNVHVVPNHALIILGLLYGEGDFQKSLMICNTCGWDTDCNSGNLGCLLGIRNGLQGFEGNKATGQVVDWRGPVADRMMIPTADGGGYVTDAVTKTFEIVNITCALNDMAPVSPKNMQNGTSPRFHFELPGGVQGFFGTGDGFAARIQNVTGHSRLGQRSLQIMSDAEAAWGAFTSTFLQPQDLDMKSYEVVSSPTIYPGQTIRAGLWAEESNANTLTARFAIQYYDANDQIQQVAGEAHAIAPGEYKEITWVIPDLPGMPIFAAGVIFERAGTCYLDYLTWDGTPTTTFQRPSGGMLPLPGARIWRMAWVNALDQWDIWFPDAFRLSQNEGRGLLITGTREWRDYRVSAVIRPTVVKAGGIAARVQGQRRFYALQLIHG